MRALAIRFNGILRGKNPDVLDEWIDDAIDTELTAIKRFASVLRRDIFAIKTQLNSWSSGQAEGQINRLKTLKRAMYGRAGPELMRVRMLPLNQWHTSPHGARQERISRRSFVLSVIAGPLKTVLRLPKMNGFVATADLKRKGG